MATLDSDDLTNIAEAVWSYIRRTLTFSPQNLASITNGTNLSIVRGDTFVYEFTGIDMTNYESSFFTIKENYKDNDYESVVQVSSASGLLYLNGVRQVSGRANAEIISGSASLKVKIYPTATQNIKYYTDSCKYDLQVNASGSITTPYLGDIDTIRDATKRIS